MPDLFRPVRLFLAVVLLCVAACSPGGSVSSDDPLLAAAPPGASPAVMDLYWVAFQTEPITSTPATAVVTPNGMLGVSGEFASTDANFYGDVEIQCLLDGGSAGEFYFTVSVIGGYGTFYHEVPVSQLSVSAGSTYFVDAVLDVGNAWQEFHEGPQNVSGNEGWIAFVEVASSPQSGVDLVAVASSSWFSPAVISAPGAPLSASVIVDNIGDSHAGTFDVGFYASLNTTISPSDALLGIVSVNGVSAGASVTVSTASLDTGGLALGANYYIGWILDAGSVIAESNEGNNVGYVSSPTLSVNGSSYAVTTSTQFGYSSLGGGATVFWDGSAGTYDLEAKAIISPFPILFFGQSIGQLWISTKGFVKFSASSTGSTNYINDPIPDTAPPNSIAALFWDDLVVGATQGGAGQIVYGSVSADVLGSAPNRSLVIQYTNMRRYNGAGYMSGQVWIHEQPLGVNSVIELVYPPGQSASWVDVSASIGIESPSGAIGYAGPQGSPSISTKPTVNYRYQ